MLTECSRRLADNDEAVTTDDLTRGRGTSAETKRSPRLHLNSGTLLSSEWGVPQSTPADTPLPDFEHVHRELARKGVTRKLLWKEYTAATPDGINYSRFCELYQLGRALSTAPRRRLRDAGSRDAGSRDAGAGHRRPSDLFGRLREQNRGDGR